MKKRYLPAIGLFGVLLLLGVMAGAYDNVETHPTINGAAFNKFVSSVDTIAKYKEKFKNYEFYFETGTKFMGPAVTAPGLWDIEERTQDKTTREWIEHGGYSADEPEVHAALRHFYDPKMRNNGKRHLTNRGTYWEGTYPNPGIDAKSWALVHSDNPWSWENGLIWMQKALEESDEGLRGDYMAKAYRCLGETMHLLADMGCPVHVRNDSHAPSMALGLLGDPDPYESAATGAVVTANKDRSPEPAMAGVFRSAEAARDLFEELANFTNENFFTNQTITGMGSRQISPINSPAYLSPELEDMTYDAPRFAFIKKFDSGAEVMMCKDLHLAIDPSSYVTKVTKERGYPYVNKECVESQATVLIPNVVEACANLMRLFIPKFRVVINEIDDEGWLSGEVVHVTDEEYPTDINYTGEVRIFVDGAVVGKTDASGRFAFKMEEELTPENVVTATIRFGDIYVNSDPFTPGEQKVDLIKALHKTIWMDFDLMVTSHFSNGEDDEDWHEFCFSLDYDTLTWNGAEVTGFEPLDESWDEGGEWLTVNFNSDGSVITSLKYKLLHIHDNTDIDPTYYWKREIEVEAHNLPLYHYGCKPEDADQSVYYRMTGTQVGGNISLKYKYEDRLRPMWTREYVNSDWTDESYMEAYFATH